MYKSNKLVFGVYKMAMQQAGQLNALENQHVRFNFSNSLWSIQFNNNISSFYISDTTFIVSEKRLPRRIFRKSQRRIQ